jgi:hypothetical protein
MLLLASTFILRHYFGFSATMLLFNQHHRAQIGSNGTF